MAVGVLDDDRELLYRSTAPSVGLPQDEVIATLERQRRAAVEARPNAVAIGLGIPCTIDRQRGEAIEAVNLDLADVPIRDMMAERLGLPTFIDNDANVAALAEYHYGAARGTRNMVLLTIGTGIGGGLILEGRPYRGTIGAGAELGHMVIDVNGPKCQGNCPNYGCVEALASGHALAREGAAAAEREPDSALGRLAAAGETIDGAAVTTAAGEPGEHLRPRRDRDRRRCHHRGGPAARSRARGGLEAGAAPDERGRGQGGRARTGRRADRRCGDGGDRVGREGLMARCRTSRLVVTRERDTRRREKHVGGVF